MAKPHDVRALGALEELSWYQASLLGQKNNDINITERALELNRIMKFLSTQCFGIFDELDTVLAVSDSVVLPVTEDNFKLGRKTFILVTRAFVELFVTHVLLDTVHCNEIFGS